MESRIRLRRVSSPVIGDILVRSAGFTFASSGEPNHTLGPPDPAAMTDLRAVMELTADCVYEHEHASEKCVDLVVSAGVHVDGLAATSGRFIARRLQERQGSPVDTIMVCHSTGGLRAYRAGGTEPITMKEIGAAVVRRRILFTSNVWYVGALVSHVMRAALKSRFQGRRKPSFPEALIAGVSAPVIRDRLTLVEADQREFLGFNTNVYAIVLKEMEPRATTPGTRRMYHTFTEGKAPPTEPPPPPPPSAVPATSPEEVFEAT